MSAAAETGRAPAVEARADEPFTAFDGGDGGTVFTCLLCGGRFTHAERVCSGCPLAAGCDIVACPHCGYQFPRTSRVVEAFRSLLRRLNAGRAP